MDTKERKNYKKIKDENRECFEELSINNKLLFLYDVINDDEDQFTDWTIIYLQNRLLLTRLLKQKIDNKITISYIVEKD